MTSIALACVLVASTGAGDAFVERVEPVLARHCVLCHSGAEPKGDLALDVFADERAALARPPVWRVVREKLARGAMPPKERPRPSKDDVDAALAWIDAHFAAETTAFPPLRRLSRYEFGRSVRDLFGVDFDAESELPPDDVGLGFDNVAAVLPTSDAWLERYLSAAERIAARAVVVDEAPAVRRVIGRRLRGRSSNARGDDRSLYTNGEVDFDDDLPRAGEYVVRARACGDQAGPEPCRMKLVAGDARSDAIDVRGEPGAGAVFEARLRVDGGRQRIGAAFVNDYWKPDAPNAGDRDRNLIVEWLEIEGPLDRPPPSAFQRRELADDADACSVVERLALRAFRRPPVASEVDALVALAPRDASRAEVVCSSIAAVVVSPSFLFRAGSGLRASIGAHELASRLSYFLWSSCPDDDLLARASAGELATASGLAREAERLLDDARASSLAESFAEQWLGLRALDRVQPDARRFPEFDDALRGAMRAETELLFEAILRERRPARELLVPRFAFANERLAKHYGLPGVRGEEMRRVSLDLDSPRGGLLGQASIALVTSNPTRTSPSRRGKWILETLLGAPPPPPPPGVGVLDESAQSAHATMRERLERHRADPACAACHASIDPLGFGLENLDAIGAWRETDGGNEIDARGELSNGAKFSGPHELALAVAADPAFVRALLEKLFVYALGRAPAASDLRALDEAAARLGETAMLRDLVLAIVALPSFRLGA